jgi:hypothetical protein
MQIDRDKKRLNGFVWVRFDACFGPPKLTFDPAVIDFSPVFKMGSFCKNDF